MPESREHGGSGRRGRPRLTPEAKEAIIKLRVGGAFLHEIAAEAGVSVVTVWRVVRQARCSRLAAMTRQAASQRGEGNHAAKLDAAAAMRVHALRAAGLSLAEVGRRVGVTGPHVANILSGRQWPDVKRAFEAGGRDGSQPVYDPAEE